MDKLSFLGTDVTDPSTLPAADAPTPQPEPAPAEPQADTPAAPVEPAEPATQAPQRGADGKFVSAQPADQPAAATPATPAPEAPAAPAAAPSQSVDPGHVPISALLDERDKRQKLEAQLAALEAAKPAPQAPEPPDPNLDPEGARQYQDAQQQQFALNIRLDVSEDLARVKHGDETVDKAREWVLGRMNASPSFRDEVLSNRNPYEFAVQAFQRDQVISGLTPERLAAFEAWQTAQASGQPQVQPATPPSPLNPAPAPPRSLATESSAGGASHVPSGPGQAFDAAFSKG